MKKWYNIEDNPFPALVWGEDWRYVITFSQNDAIYALPAVDNTIPTQVSQSAEGYMYSVWGWVMGRTLVGNPDPLTLGAVHVHYTGQKNEFFEGGTPEEGYVWYTPVAGADFETDTTCKFRIYAGECETLPGAFAREDVLALLNGEAATGPRTSLHYHARNVEIQFPTTSTAKYRVLAVPFNVLNTEPGALPTAPEVTVGRTANRLRYVDDTDVTLTRTDIIYGSMTTGGGFMIWMVYIIPATTSAFSVFLRALASNGQNLGVTKPANTPTPGHNTSPWTEVKTWTKPAGGEVIGVTVEHQIAWSGRWRLENLEPVARTYDLVDAATVTYTTSAGTFNTLSVNNNISGLLFGAWDTSTDFAGASGLNQLVQVKTTTYSTLTLSGSQLDPFIDNATVDITLDCVRVVSAITGGIDNWGNLTNLATGTTSSVHLTACYVNTYMYLDGPTGDPA